MSLVVGLVAGSLIGALGIGGAFLFLAAAHPEKIRIWASWFYAGARLLFKRAEYGLIANDVSGRLGQHLSKELSHSIDGVSIPQVVIRWDNSVEAVARERDGTLIVRMRSHEDRVLNILHASLAATPRLVAPTIRPQLSPGQSRGIDLQLCRRLAESLGESAHTSFALEVLQPVLDSVPGLQEVLERFDAIDSGGLFKAVLLQELVKLAARTRAGHLLPDLPREVRALTAFLVRIARRRPGELTALSFVGRHMRISTMLVAKSSTRAVGVKAYRGRAGLELGKGAETIYVLSRGVNVPFAEEVVRALDADRRFIKQRAKKVTVNRNGERERAILVPFERNPGYSATQHFKDSIRVAGVQRGSRATVVVTDVEDEYVLADLNGIQVHLPCEEVSWGDVPDCRKHVQMGEEVQVEVVRVDELRRELVASRRLCLPNPLAHLRDDQLIGLRETMVVEAQFDRQGGYVSGYLKDTPKLPVRLSRAELDWGSDEALLPNVGEEFPVLVASVNRTAGILGASRKRLVADRWEVIRDRYRHGSRLTVKAQDIGDVGVTCELEPGLSGFIPAEEFRQAGYEYRDYLKTLRQGQALYVYVRRVVAGDRQRVTLGLQQNLPTPP